MVTSLKFLKRISKTISLRLTLWYSAIFILSSLLLFIFAYFFLSLSVQKKDREIIKAELKECATKYQKDGIDSLKKEVEFEKHASGKNPFFVRLAGPHNNTIFLNIPQQLSEFDLKQLENIKIKNNKQWIQLESKDHEDVLEILSYPLPDGFLLQVGKSIENRKELLERFRAIFAAIIIPVIFIGFVCGLFLTSRTLRPVRYLINTIHSIIDTSKIDARMQTSQRDDELDELSMLFNTMLEKIETLITGIREGLDNVAHDLRTPIMRLRSTAEIALQSEQNIDILRNALSDCVEESERILAMLNTLMDISEAETGTMKLDMEKVNIANLTEEVVDLYSYVAEEKNISVHASFPKELYVTADRNRLRQILANLLDNAIKYTPVAGRIDIETFQKNNKIVVIVKDNGIGIPPEELPRIWNRLYRGDKSRSQHGLGLGLSLVKAIVQAHKGYIEVSSESGKGSLFTISFPSKC